MTVEGRPSPELFAFTQAASQMKVKDCRILESLDVRADLQDDAYKRMLQRRFEESSITVGNRSMQATVAEVTTARNSTVSEEAKRANHAAFGKQVDASEVALVVEGALLAAGAKGLTLEEILESFQSVQFAALRDALVAAAEQVVDNGVRRYRASELLMEIAAAEEPQMKRQRR
jgi:uncharacterized protein (DUF433 family)